MRAAGLVVGRALALLADAARPGVTTLELDRIAEDSIRSAGAVPSFLGYGDPPFPGSICASVNDEVVHGIPGERVLLAGDQISIDCGAILAGWHGDAAITVGVGQVATEDAELSRVTGRRSWRGLAAAQVGGRLTDIGHAVESYVRSQPDGARYGIVEEYVGHGIGTQMHMEPNVPNYGAPGRGPTLQAGMALAVEPMVTARKAHPRGARRRVDGRHRRRAACCALGAHRRADRRGALGAHGAGRRCRGVRRARRRLARRPPRLSPRSSPRSSTPASTRRSQAGGSDVGWARVRVGGGIRTEVHDQRGGRAAGRAVGGGS